MRRRESGPKVRSEGASLGPFSLLHESEANHWGKMTFRWVYWNLLLPGKDMPFEPLMSMAGKEVEVPS